MGKSKKRTETISSSSCESDNDSSVCYSCEKNKVLNIKCLRWRIILN